eukprot:3857929-Amphidinium_carterae.1
MSQRAKVLSFVSTSTLTLKQVTRTMKAHVLPLPVCAQACQTFPCAPCRSAAEAESAQHLRLYMQERNHQVAARNNYGNGMLLHLTTTASYTPANSSIQDSPTQNCWYRCWAVIATSAQIVEKRVGQFCF